MASLARRITQFTKQEVDQLWKNAQSVLKHDVGILLRAPRQHDIGRILIIVPKKVGTAPERNKLRRQIKAIFYENKFYQKDFDWIFLVKKPITQLNFQEIASLLLTAMAN